MCWTEASESGKILGSQRNRWQRGTMQVLGYHKRMLLNSRYGVVGMFAMPYCLLFEALGPAMVGVIETFGYRQLTTRWRLKGVRDYFKKAQGWGTMTRKGFTKP